MVSYKQGKIKLSVWRKLRRMYPGQRGETFSDYIERITLILEDRYYGE